ncbi:HTH domain-containing protein, partial [Enterococcus faecium]|nr:HTH domain-containing protein [Enterococcus faecium]
MLEKYIEKDILRQVKILEYFYERRQLTMQELIDDLNVNKKTIIKDFSKIEQSIENVACFKVTDKGRINFYLMGETKYITYVEEEYISVSKAFKLRKEVQKFLKVSGYLNEEERETKNEL